jgi:hypothetical protein
MTIEKLFQKLETMSPFYQAYFVDRVSHMLQDIKNDLPAYHAQCKASEAEGKISMFHANFFVHFFNEIDEVINPDDERLEPFND